MFTKGNHIAITEAEGGGRTTIRTVYQVTDDGFFDTQGGFWPVADNDQLRYRLCRHEGMN